MPASDKYPKDTSVFIVGASVFGLSTALHLAQAGYENITVFDRSTTLPSPFAASHDLNKIIRAEYGADHASDDFYTDLALSAIEAWETPEWKDCFRKVGYLRLAESEKKQANIIADMIYFSVSTAYKAQTARRWFPDGSFCPMSSVKDIRAVVPHLPRSTDEEEWKGYVNKHAGYALASEAIRLAYQRCRDMGVKFVLHEEDGQVVKLIEDSERPGSTISIRSISGRDYLHRKDVPSVTILALGAHIGKLVPAIRSQITAKAWSVAHLQLTKSEALALWNTPVVNLSELGFWMEPLRITVEQTSRLEKIAVPAEDDPEDSTYLLKLCCHGGGWTNMRDKSSTKQYSVPPDEQYPTIPEEDEAQLREVVERSLPRVFHKRPFVRKSICWCADTASSDYVVDHVPGYTNVVLVGADSGHAFKMLPIAGSWVLKFLQQGEQRLDRWKLKIVDEQAKHEVQHVSWRIGAVKDIGSVKMMGSRVQDMVVA